jgi:hypothetical protein
MDENQIPQDEQEFLDIPEELEIPKPSQLLVKQVTLLDMVDLDSFVYIDDANNQAGVLEESIVHNALKDLIAMNLLGVSWEHTKRVLLDSKLHYGNFIVGLSPIQVREARDYVQALFMRTTSKEQIAKQINDFSNSELLSYLKKMKFRKESIEKIMECVNSDTMKASEAVKTTLWAIVDISLESICNPIGSEPSLESESVKKVEDEENKELNNDLIRELSNINPDLLKCFTSTHSQFELAGVDINEESAKEMMKVHLGSVVRCFFHTNPEMDDNNKKILNDLSILYNQICN